MKYGTSENQKACSALASLGVFASLWVANPRKGRLRDAEAAAREGGDVYEGFAQGDVWEGRSHSIAQAGQRAYLRPVFANLSSQFANCGGGFVVAEMNGFVIYLSRSEKVFYPQT